MTNSHFKEDCDLIERIKEGDQKAFLLFYNKYKGPIYQVLYNVVKNKDVSDDLLNIVFTKAYLRASTYVTHISLYMWLKTIATNTAIDFIRKSRKEINNKYVDDEDTRIQLEDRDYNDPETLLEYQQTQIVLNEAIANLKPRHRTILMDKLAGLTYKQIAEKNSTSEAVVKASLNKARGKLKQTITL